MTARPFVLDTDIGTNVDDLLALLLVVGSPELDLVGVTTVSGDTGVRAAVAERALHLVGRDDVPVVAGATTALSGVAPRWAGYEARLADRSVTAGPADATDWLRDLAARQCGRLEIGSIAPLTNLARALRADPGFADAVSVVHLMGGAPDGPEHNLAADAVAAAEVLGAMDVRVCGTDVTGAVRLDAAGLRAVLGAAADQPIGALVTVNAGLLWDDRGVDSSIPHDPLALLAAVRPDLVRCVMKPTSVAGDGRIVDAGRVQGRIAALDPAGPEEAWRRVRAGASGPRPATPAPPP